MRMRSVLLSFAICASWLSAANALQFEKEDRYGYKIKTCATSFNCNTMPNPLDLDGLKVRQDIDGSERTLILYPAAADLSCGLKAGSFIRSVRLKVNQPEIVLEVPPRDLIRIECRNEKTLRSFIFYVPAVKYMPNLLE